MAPHARGPLTKPMFYILMSLLKRPMCGTEIADFALSHTGGRVRLGPGTLYTLLGKFLDEAWIEQTEAEGRKRTYQLTDRGRSAYEAEVARLRACLADAEEEDFK